MTDDNVLALVVTCVAAVLAGLAYDSGSPGVAIALGFVAVIALGVSLLLYLRPSVK